MGQPDKCTHGIDLMQDCIECDRESYDRLQNKNKKDMEAMQAYLEDEQAKDDLEYEDEVDEEEDEFDYEKSFDEFEDDDEVEVELDPEDEEDSGPLDKKAPDA